MYRRVCTLSELLQLLKAGGMAFVHRFNLMPTTQASNRDVAVCAISNRECANVRRM